MNRVFCIASVEVAGQGALIRLGRGVAIAMEVVLTTLLCLAPWGFGGAIPTYEFWLDCGIALVVFLWAARMVLTGRIVWQFCPVALCLAAIFFLGVWQLVPLPKNVLRIVSPGTAEIYARLLPAQPEVIGPDVPAADVHAATGHTISLYPHATRRLLLRLLAVFVLFSAVRNNLSPVGVLRRLGIAMLVNGALLSLFGLVQHWTFGAATSCIGMWNRRG